MAHVDLRHSTVNFVSGDQHVYPTKDPLQQLQPADMDAALRKECLTGTRTSIIQQILDWACDPNSAHSVFLLNGLAGSGKSTLSTTIANRLSIQGRLGAFIFFDREVAERNDPAVVIRTVAFLLGSTHPRIGEAITKTLEKYNHISQLSLENQFKHLLSETLLSDGVVDDEKPLIVVMDALDECGDVSRREALLHLIAEYSARIPIRFLITSRPESDILAFFEDRDHIFVQNLDILSDDIHHDISIYVKYRMECIRKKKRRLRVQANWPGEKIVKSLTDRASGLFIWASTASEFIDAHVPEEQLEKILHGHTEAGADHALENLDALYRTALQLAGDWDDKRFIHDFRLVMGVILVTRIPLSSNAIHSLLESALGISSLDVVAELGCVLQQQPTLRFLHPSFGDFLLSKERSLRPIWFFNHSLHSRTLALSCVDLLEKTLKQNLRDLTFTPRPFPDLPASKHFTEAFSYACNYWVDHVCSIEDNIPERTSELDLLQSFIREHLLHWIEVMLIMHKPEDVLLHLSKLNFWLSVSQSHLTSCINHQLGEFQTQNSIFEETNKLVLDAKKLVSEIDSAVNDPPLLLHSTVLLFTRTDSALFEILGSGLYTKHPRENPFPFVRTLEGHEASVSSVGFSLDGARLASGSDNGSIRLWNLESDSCISIAGDARDGGVTSLAFSGDGTQLVSSSSKGVINVWRTVTGDRIHTIPPHLQGHEHQIVESVAFSPDDTEIMLGLTGQSHWHSIFIEGSETAWAIEGHEDDITSIALSSDGRLISGSWDETICVWDAGADLKFSRALRIHEGAVTSVAISSDGTRGVSGSWDKTVCVWDTISGEKFLPPLQGHETAVTSVALSADGKTIASGSEDGNIRLWDAFSGSELLPVMVGHTGSVQSLAVSQNRIVSGSSDKTVRVWDLNSRSEALPPLRGHEHGVSSVAFLNNAMRVASGGLDKAVRIWDLTTQTEIYPALQGHPGAVTSLAVSGHILASGSWDGSILVWDVTSGSMMFGILRGHDGPIYSIAFSSDKASLFSASGDKSIRQWDAYIGELQAITVEFVDF